jgi:O-antigen/teichoic acid export membrane protein
MSKVGKDSRSAQGSGEHDGVNSSAHKDEYFKTGHLKEDLGVRTVRGGAVTLVSQGATFLITLLATALMARLLTPQDYGLIGMVAIFTNFIAMFKDMGLSAATVQRPEITNAQISTLFWLNVVLSVAVMTITMALAPAVAWFYGDWRLLGITVASSVGFLFGGLSIQHEALLRRQMRFVILAAVGIISMIFGYIVGIITAWHGWKYWALISSQLAVAISNTGIVWFVCRWRPGFPKRGTGVRSMVTFGSNLTGFGIINYFSRNLDNLLIGRIWGPQQLGLYNKSYQLMMLPIDQINVPIYSVAVPALSRLADADEKYRQVYLRMLEKIAILTMPPVALMIATSDWIVQIVLGPQWSEASRIFVLLGITGLFQPIANTTGWLFMSQGRGDRLLRWGLISGPLTMASIILGMPWGAVGVAAAYAAVRVLVTDPLLYWFVGRAGPVRTIDFYRTMAPFAFASFCVVLVLLGFRNWSRISNPLIGVSICFLLTIFVTVLALYILPAGRRALKDLRTSLLLLRKPEKSLI